MRDRSEETKMRARVVSKTQLYGSIPGKVLNGQRDGETRQMWDGVGGVRARSFSCYPFSRDVVIIAMTL